MPVDSPLLRFRLSAMMFLQYAVWGVWAPILGLHLGELKAFQTGGEPDQGRIGLIYMTMPIASMVAPFIGGQIADRYFAAQRFLAVSHLLGGAILMLVARMTGLVGIFFGMLIYNLLYAPTIALTNSIVFQHWPNDRFSRIRVWGSIGWIVVGWVFGILWMKLLGPLLGFRVAMGQCLYLAAGLSFVLGVFSLLLPHTPPARQLGNPLAFLDALALMRKPAFAVMVGVAFFVAMELQLYFVWGQAFLKQGLGLSEELVGPALTVGQICELLMMVVLPLVLRRHGFRMTMAIGIAAWGLRDLLFAVGWPWPLVLGAVSLHGVGFAFFFTVIFMFADTVAPGDIKSSVQSFLASVTIGCGMLVGSLLAGPISWACGNHWSRMFLVPAALCGICLVVLMIGFQHREGEQAA